MAPAPTPEQTAGRVDLHMHTRCSDGTYSVPELFARVAAARLRAFALTDHDTVAGIDEITALGREAGIECIPALELSTSWKGTDFHVLGYFIDHRDPRLLDALAGFRGERTTRADTMVKKLRSLGLDVTMEDVQSVYTGGSMGRPHIAMAMVKKGIVPDIETAFQRWLRVGAPGYVSKFQLETPQGVRLIRENGGVAVLAHPGTCPRPDLIPEILDSGVDGIECAHPKHGASQEERFRETASRRGIVPTGGSDCHGEKTSDTPVACRTVGYEIVEALRAKRP